MKYTKSIIRDLRKGIVMGELITKAQEEMLAHFNILIPNVEGPSKTRIVHNKIDAVLRRMSHRKNRDAFLQKG